jgi:hypothetical protein
MAIDYTTLAAATAAVPVVLYLLHKPILKLFTPQGIPGIPAYPNPSPILGDLWRMGQEIKKLNGFGPFLDQVSRDLGPIVQVRLSFKQT